MSNATYIGTKVVIAEPMTRQAYNDYRGWSLPADENGDDEGYLVEYTDGGQANMPDRKGYVSWSPKDVFERTYRRNRDRGMTFGTAIDAMKHGCRVARSGWNGRGMCIWLNKGSFDMSNRYLGDDTVAGIARHLFEWGDRGTGTRLPNINMQTAGGDLLTGWLASQTDMLAEDWEIVE